MLILLIISIHAKNVTCFRNDRWTDTDSFAEDANASDDLDTKSDVSDGRTTKSVESSMSSDFMYTSQAGGFGSKVLFQ